MSGYLNRLWQCILHFFGRDKIGNVNKRKKKKPKKKQVKPKKPELPASGYKHDVESIREKGITIKKRKHKVKREITKTVRSSETRFAEIIISVQESKKNVRKSRKRKGRKSKLKDAPTANEYIAEQQNDFENYPKLEGETSHITIQIEQGVSGTETKSQQQIEEGETVHLEIQIEQETINEIKRQQIQQRETVHLEIQIEQEGIKEEERETPHFDDRHQRETIPQFSLPRNEKGSESILASATLEKDSDQISTPQLMKEAEAILQLISEKKDSDITPSYTTPEIIPVPVEVTSKNYFEETQLVFVKKKTPLEGMHNQGNTCYINSALQLLKVCDYFEEKDFSSPAGRAIKQLFTGQQNIEHFVCSMESLVEFQDMYVRTQQDTAHFIERAFNNMKTNGDDNALEDFMLVNPKYNQCPQCNPNQIVTRKNKLFLMPIPDCGATLQQQIDAHLNYSQECNDCEKLFERNLRYHVYPKYLLIKTDNNYGNDKKMFMEPITFGDERQKYFVVGCALHSGGRTSGHYTALVKHQQQWSYCNDSIVKKHVDLQDVKFSNFTFVLLLLKKVEATD